MGLTCIISGVIRTTKGLWRRTSFADYQSNDPKWEIVIDLDALAAKEDENWVWKGANLCYPKSVSYTHLTLPTNREV